MFNSDDDDFGFPSSSGSSLSSLFGVDQSIHQVVNESLTYTAPKQPKKPKEIKEHNPPNAPSVLHAVVVHAYKYVDNKYAKQGKLGAAILGDYNSGVYSLWLYVTKQQQVTSARITSNFIFTIQPNNYASFYDDQRQNWSIMFETEQNAIEFAKQVGMSKFNSCKPLTDKVIIQDLLLGIGNSIEGSDSIEVCYTGWLFSDGAIGQEFESNVGAEKFFRFKINASKSKVIKGLEEGLIGIKKNGRRLLIIPPNLGYGNQGLPGKVPPNTYLIYDIEVTKVKQGKEKDSPRASSPITIQAQNEQERKLSESREDIVKSRSHSITQQLSQSPTSDKAKIISRMAKMGQQMLPLQGSGAVQAEDSDTEIEQTVVSDGEESAVKPEIDSTSPQNKPVPKPRPSTISQPSKPETVAATAPPPFISQPVAVFQPNALPQHMPQSFMPYGFSQMASGPYNIYTPPFPPQPPTQTPPQSNHDAHLPLLMSETRQQNTEIRLGVNKINDKLDRMGMKLDQLYYESMKIVPQRAFIDRVVPEMAHSYSTAPVMESNVLLNNLQKIILENDSLKKEVLEKNDRIEAQSFKITDLLRKTQLFYEQGNSVLEQRSDSLANTTQSKVQSLEQEKIKLLSDLNVANQKVNALETNLDDQRRRESDLQNQLSRINNVVQKNQDETVFLQEQSNNQEKNIEQLTIQLKEERSHCKQLQFKITNLEEDIMDLKNTKEALEKNLSEAKKKVVSIQKRSEEELDELRVTHEAEFESLHSKYRKSKTSAESPEQVIKIQEDLNVEWQEKCNRMLVAAGEKHKKALEVVQEENQSLLNQIEGMEIKLNSFQNSSRLSNSQISELESQIESLKDWQQKHAILQASIENLKGSYGNQILQLKQQLMQQNNPVTSTSSDLFSEVKRIMNSVYHHLQSQFDAEENYSGTEINQTILRIIKTVTLELMSKQLEAQEQDDEDNNEDASSVVQEEITTENNEEPSQVDPPNGSQAEENQLTQHQEAVISDSHSQNNEEKATDLVINVEVSQVIVEDDDESGKPQPPPPPLFEDDDDDDWIK